MQRFFLILPLIIFLINCSSHVFEIKTRADLPINEARSILERVSALRGKIKSIIIKADAKIDSRENRFVFEEFITAMKPDMASLTTIKFGTPVLYLSVKSDAVTAFDPRENRYYFGKDFSQVMQNIMDLRLGFRDMIESMFGTLFLPENFEIQKAELLNERYFKIVLAEANQKSEETISREILIDGKKNLFVSAKIKSEGNEEAVSISFLDYRKLEGFEYPFKIVIKRENPWEELVLKITEAKIAEGLTDQEFNIKIPEGYVPLPLRSLGRLF